MRALRALRDALGKAPLPTAAGLRGGLDILGSTDLRARLGALTMPVLLLAGARDTLVPVAALRLLAQRYAGLRLHEFPSAGHAPFISHANEVVEVLAEFLG